MTFGLFYYLMIMKNIYYTLILLTSFSTLSTRAYSQQINIPQVQLMPTMPSPLLMRNWSAAAGKYDSLVYNLNATGINWPIVRLGSSGVNYPDIRPIFMDSYVGSASHGNQAEAINILPSIVGATLVGIDKSKEFGVNWVQSSEDFFNSRNGQNVYLNGTSATSGSDWWYDIMPNVFFYQLYSLYPSIPNFSSQFTSVANVWQNAVYKMGGSSTPWTIPNMNYRAWYLATNTPNASGVIEPEAAGSLSWLMYNAYKTTGNINYLYTAEMCMDFLNGLTTDPSYEIQLPYGALTAARMNAELGSNYNITNIVNWVFNEGPLRDWGTITGNWDGEDVSGLVGDEDPGNNYVFLMNGFQQAAALVPLVKYDKRFASSVARWTLNLSNAARLYYTPYLPDSTHCDSYDWSVRNDPDGVIGHEAIEQVWNNVPLFARGDAIINGWASTDLGLYGSSHIGYLGAIINPTNVTGILSLDLDKTDFFGNNIYPVYLIYNPYSTSQDVTLNPGTGTYDIYDAITEKVILSGASGASGIAVPSDSVRLLIYLPHGTVLTPSGGKLYAGTNIVDYHYQNNYSGQFRVKALVAKNPVVLFNSLDTIYCTVDNAPSAVVYNWAVNGTAIPYGTGSVLNWQTPASAGIYKISCKVTSDDIIATDTVLVNVVTVVPEKPVISGLNLNKKFYYTRDTLKVNCIAKDINGSALTYSWNVNNVTVLTSDSASASWIAPDTAGIFDINCVVTNSFKLSSDTSAFALVKSTSIPAVKPLIYYPFDGNVNDYSGNGYNAILTGAVPTSDPMGRADSAYEFNNSADIIYTPNNTALNFQDKITISFWLKLDQVTAESYVISHGSWQDRYKVSVIPGNILRWTVKTNNTTLDLDNSVPLVLGTWYHFTVAYTGYSMEIYENGVLDVFEPQTGQIQQTTQDITIGQELLGQDTYTLFGAVDEVRIFDGELSMSQIQTLPAIWDLTAINQATGSDMMVYPNPSNGLVYIRSTGENTGMQIEAIDITGRILGIITTKLNADTYSVELLNSYHGLVIIKVFGNTSQNYFKVLFL